MSTESNKVSGVEILDRKLEPKDLSEPESNRMISEQRKIKNDKPFNFLPQIIMNKESSKVKKADLLSINTKSKKLKRADLLNAHIEPKKIKEEKSSERKKEKTAKSNNTG